MRDQTRLRSSSFALSLRPLLLLAGLATFVAGGPFAAAQGTLTPPPGAPAPSMKTLGELDASVLAVAAATDALLARAEPRRAVNATNTPPSTTASFVISEPGSYYLTANLTGESGKAGIHIATSHVVLDLNGFHLAGPGTETGITTSSGANVVIRHGTLQNWATGINATAANTRIMDVSVNATTGFGIRTIGVGALIERCLVRSTGDTGILAHTDQSVVRECIVSLVTAPAPATSTVYGIRAGVVEQCAVRDITSTLAGSFVYGISGEVVARSRASGVTSPGSTWLIAGDTIEGCAVQNSGYSASGQLVGLSGRTVRGSTVSDLIGSGPSLVLGITAVRVTDCVVETLANSGSGSVAGIRGGAGASTGGSSAETGTISDCSVSDIDGMGVQVVGSAAIEQNRVGYCTTGISASSGTVRGNFTHNNTTGISLSAGLATGNTSRTDTTAFSFGGSVRAGPTLVGGGIGAFDPNANLDL